MEASAPRIAIDVELVLVLVRLRPADRRQELDDLLDGVARTIVLCALARLACEPKVEVAVRECVGAHVALDDRLGAVVHALDEAHQRVALRILGVEEEAHTLR